MSLINFFLTVLSMNVIFNRVTAQEKKQLRKLENKGKALMRAETAVILLKEQILSPPPPPRPRELLGGFEVIRLKRYWTCRDVNFLNMP